MKKGKKHLEALSKVEKNKAYSLNEAVKLVKETSYNRKGKLVRI